MRAITVKKVEDIRVGDQIGFCPNEMAGVSFVPVLDIELRGNRAPLIKAGYGSVSWEIKMALDEQVLVLGSWGGPA